MDQLEPVSFESILPAQGSVGRERHTNLFDLLRVMAAAMVLYGHAFALTTGGEPPGFFANSISTIGVKIFFVISGLMITQSWLADSRPWAYAMRRILRIIPGLALVVLVTVLLLGPLVTTFSLRDYAHAGLTRLYLWNILLYPVYTLPGVFAGNPYPNAVNGSLWSLPPEALMYVLTPIVVGRAAVFGKVGTAMFAVATAAVGVYYVQISPIVPTPVFYGTGLSGVLEVAPYFQLGSLLAVLGPERFIRPVLSLLLFVIVGLAIHLEPQIGGAYGASEILLLLTLPFVVLSVGSIPVGGRVGRILSRADVSYGLYLYGFPIQQTISAHFGGQIGPFANFCLTLPMAFVCGLISWHTVEKTALRLKPRRRSADRQKS